MRRVIIGLVAAAICARGEIRDVLPSADLERLFAGTHGERIVHARPNFAIVLRVAGAEDSATRAEAGADEVWFIRKGSGRLALDQRQYQIGAGDVIYIPRRTSPQLAAGPGRFEYIAVRVFPEGDRQPPALGGILAPRRMPDVLKKSDIDATFQKFDVNQPIHAGRNFTMNYVIYKGRSGPWEAHRGCVDLYFLHHGTATAQLGGEIAHPRDDPAGEIRGDAVSGARKHRIGPGDLVVIPRNTAHHMIPDSASLGYLLIKVWAE